MGEEPVIRKPWYLRRRPPVFCDCCRAIYYAIFPGRACTLYMGVFLWILGFVLILSSILVCIARECAALAGAFVPLGIILMWLGYALFHCGWAAHLLEDRQGPWSHTEGGGPESEPTIINTYTDDGIQCTDWDPNRTQKGYWQFADEAAWQAVSSRDQLQYTMKPINAP